ncbi:MAG: DUF192 domain-containing protein [Treponema sp.]|nr:DUF192 domain-containing protein [Candidatus Treponema caballi]
MRKNKLPFFVIAACLLFISCKSGNALPVKSLEIALQNGTSVTVEAEIADTEESRNHGFMEREEIPDGTGMLFVFDRDQRLSFWMKNTPHPLSIAFIDARGKIRDIFDMKPYSVASTISSVSCRYALEVPQGWFERVGVTVGDTIPCLPEQF